MNQGKQNISRLNIRFNFPVVITGVLRALQNTLDVLMRFM